MGISCAAVAGPVASQPLGGIAAKGGDSIKQQSLVLKIFTAGTLLNLLLFGVKLYVGLSVNSICIWSDAINNLADALSCLASLGFTVLMLRLGAKIQREVSAKGEQLLSFLLSAVVAGVGVSFAWSSLERLIYPTPVWFSMKFFFIVLFTAVAKLLMFFFYRVFARKTGSPVLRVLQADSLMDCFITTATLLSFTLTRFLSFAVDAVFGLAISVILFIGAAKLIATHLRALLNLAPRQTREQVAAAAAACEAADSAAEIRYFIGRDQDITAFVCARPEALAQEDGRAALERLAAKTKETTGVKLCFLLQTDFIQSQGRSGSAAAEESDE